MLNSANISTFRNLRNGLTLMMATMVTIVNFISVMMVKMGNAPSFLRKTVNGENQNVTKKNIRDIY